MAIDSNVVGFEEEEGFREFEEVQGQLANQGKPSFDLLMLCYLLLLSSCYHCLLIHLELILLMLTLCMLILSMYDPLDTSIIISLLV
jgi:hypothetical protein